MDVISDVSLPLGGIVLPSTQAAVGLYLLVIGLVMAADRLFLMAYPWLHLDPRRPPFAWIAIGIRQESRKLVVLWLTLPVLICAIATATTLKLGDAAGFVLSFTGILTMFLPRAVHEYWSLIQRRSDHRGGRATFSIFLLYWYRLSRQIVGTVCFLFSVLAIVPKWRAPILNVVGIALGTYVVMLLTRLIAGIPCTYRRIDLIGVRWGFPAESEHYK